MNQIILGIDPGIADTGWGVISSGNTNKLVCLAYGSVKTKAGLDLGDRLVILNKELREIISKYQPTVTGIEQLFFCNNVKTALAVGQARGVALLALRDSLLPVLEYTPLQVKQAVTGYGSASKMQVGKMVKTILNLESIPKPDDAADALAIAIAASQNSLRLGLNNSR